MLRLVVFLLFLAAVLYAFFWLVDRRNDPSTGTKPRRRGGGGTGGRPVPRGPLGPDDDEDFLRELDRERRNRERHGDKGDDA